MLILLPMNLIMVPDSPKEINSSNSSLGFVDWTPTELISSESSYLITVVFCHFIIIDRSFENIPQFKDVRKRRKIRLHNYLFNAVNDGKLVVVGIYSWINI